MSDNFPVGVRSCGTRVDAGRLTMKTTRLGQRIHTQTILLLGLLVAGGWSALAQSPGLQKISEHVYSYLGATNPAPANSFGANAGVIVGQNAALVVDTLISAKEADRLLTDIRKVTDKPIKYVVNTHYHLDHSFGNGQFAKLGATFIAQDSARDDFAKAEAALAHPESYGLTRADLEGTTLRAPDITFSNALTIDLGGTVVQLVSYGHTHTDDSIVVLVPREKVLFTGDILFSHYHPYLAEGDLAQWGLALYELGQLPVEKIIPGHGPLSDQSDLRDLRIYLERFDALARELCAGKRAQDAPAIAREILVRLPKQNRSALAAMVAGNLLRYLPAPDSKP